MMMGMRPYFALPLIRRAMSNPCSSGSIAVEDDEVGDVVLHQAQRQQPAVGPSMTRCPFCAVRRSLEELADVLPRRRRRGSACRRRRRRRRPRSTAPTRSSSGRLATLEISWPMSAELAGRHLRDLGGGAPRPPVEHERLPRGGEVCSARAHRSGNGRGGAQARPAARAAARWVGQGAGRGGPAPSGGRRWKGGGGAALGARRCRLRGGGGGGAGAGGSRRGLGGQRRELREPQERRAPTGPAGARPRWRSVSSGTRGPR